MIGQQPAIEVRGVGVLRDGRWILRDANWSVPAGTCAAILGPNGSGKSTLTRILAGHLWPTAGDVRVLGQHFGETDLQAMRRDIRLVQAAGPYDVDPDLSAREVVLSGYFGTLALYDIVDDAMAAEADRLLKLVGLAAVARHAYRTLSSGERVRSLIARALVQRPGLLLLDEPTAGLDLLAREQVLAVVESLFASEQTPPTVVMITHHVEELPPATARVLLLDDGAVAASGSPEEVLRSDVLSRVYRCPVDVKREAGRTYLHVHPSHWDQLLNPHKT